MLLTWPEAYGLDISCPAWCLSLSGSAAVLAGRLDIPQLETMQGVMA